uniref:Cell division control protein 45-like protein n=1 Tax=Schistosoma haematobium TaxID=6185 RepID=A0A094ZYP5_SCHHA
MVVIRDIRSEFYGEVVGNSDESDEDSEEQQNRRLQPDDIEKRIEKRKWNRKRQELLMDYESFSYHSVASSVVMFDLAWKLSQENNCLLWYAIVGQTSQLITHAINREHYIDQLDYLQSHMSRLSHIGQIHSGTSTSDENKARIEILFEDELALWLYRHWSLKEAIETSMVTASKFKLFTEGGQRRMYEFLVQLGLPRRECAQLYSSMNSSLRDSLNAQFLQYGEKYGVLVVSRSRCCSSALLGINTRLFWVFEMCSVIYSTTYSYVLFVAQVTYKRLSRTDLFLPSFIVHLGYRTPMSAVDAVFLTISALECYNSGNPVENFQTALDTVACWNSPSLDQEIKQTEIHLQSLANQVRNLLDTDDVVAFGPFLYVYIRKSSLVTHALRNSQSLAILSKYILMAKSSMRAKLGHGRRVVQMPLIVCVDSKSDDNYISLLGIPPIHGDDDRNLFGQAFEAAINRTKARAEFKYFSTNCIELHREDMLKLFEALSSLLT